MVDVKTNIHGHTSLSNVFTQPHVANAANMYANEADISNDYLHNNSNNNNNNHN